MTKWDDVFSEKASDEHKKNVLVEAERFLSQKNPWWKGSFKFAPVIWIAAIVFVMVLALNNKTNDLYEDDSTSMIVMADIEILENLDLLETEDLELIESMEELDGEAKI